MTRDSPLTRVGVAGFEPAASSSRSQVRYGLPGAAACLTWEAPSVGIRWRPLLSVVIVTHLVTRSFASRCASGCACGSTLARLLTDVTSTPLRHQLAQLVGPRSVAGGSLNPSVLLLRGALRLCLVPALIGGKS
jgi:hypothetical protein